MTYFQPLEREPSTQLELPGGRIPDLERKWLSKVRGARVAHVVIAEVRPVGDVVELAKESKALAFTPFEVLRNPGELRQLLDRKSTRLNSSHLVISYAVFCLKKKNKKHKYRSSHSFINSQPTPRVCSSGIHSLFPASLPTAHPRRQEAVGGRHASTQSFTTQRSTSTR